MSLGSQAQMSPPKCKKACRIHSLARGGSANQIHHPLGRYKSNVFCTSVVSQSCHEIWSQINSLIIISFLLYQPKSKRARRSILLCLEIYTELRFSSIWDEVKFILCDFLEEAVWPSKNDIYQKGWIWNQKMIGIEPNFQARAVKSESGLCFSSLFAADLFPF